MSTDILAKVEKTYSSLTDKLGVYLSPQQIDLVARCYRTALSSTFSGRAFDIRFILISVSAGLDLARLRLNPEFIGATLLYYPASADLLLPKQLTENGEQIATTIQRLVQIGDQFEKYLPWKQSTLQKKKAYWDDQYTEKFPDAFMALAKLAEINIIKLADRLSLLRVAEQMFSDPSIRQRLAEQSLEGYSVIAERLGIWFFKWQLEDEAFKILEPAIYDSIRRRLNERREEREKIIKSAIKALKRKLRKEGLLNAQIHGRAKHIYGLYLKSRQTGRPVDYVNDSLGIRILVNTEEECYQALSMLHQLWSPVEHIYGSKLYRDWIIFPKPNGYQSIHTTVNYSHSQKSNRLLEVQIRTFSMHEVAEYGAAAHWVYRKVGNKTDLQERLKNHVEPISKVRKAYEKRQEKNQT